MKLEKYNIRIILSDPDSAQTKLDVMYENVSRELLLSDDDPRIQLLIRDLLLRFEKSIVDISHSQGRTTQ